MKNLKRESLIAWLFHAVLIVLCLLFMKHDPEIPQIAVIALSVIYLIYWIIRNRRGHMPWLVYLQFFLGGVLQIALFFCGVLPEDVGMFTGFGALFYVFFLIIAVLVTGLANLVLWIADRIKSKRNQQAGGEQNI